MAIEEAFWVRQGTYVEVDGDGGSGDGLGDLGEHPDESTGGLLSDGDDGVSLGVSVDQFSGLSHNLSVDGSAESPGVRPLAYLSPPMGTRRVVLGSKSPYFCCW